MSMHKIPLTPLEEEGLKLHGLPIGKPSQLSDVFRQGFAYGRASEIGCATCRHYLPHHRSDLMHCASPHNCIGGDRFDRTEPIRLWKE